MDEKEKPSVEPIDLVKLVDDLVEDLNVDRDKAERDVKLYVWNMVRYYGYSVEYGDDGTSVKFKDRRRKKFLQAKKAAEEER